MIFSQVYHQVVAQQLITAKGQNAPGQFVLTDRGIAAYLTGKIQSVASGGAFLDESAGEPFTATEAGIPTPGSHKWAEEFARKQAAANRRFS